MTFSRDLVRRAERVLRAARSQSRRIATAESCTGGLVVGLLTEIAGSSDVVERGFVTYSNAAKSEMLGVPADLIGRCGAVSAEVAQAMAEGALARSAADLAVAVTGIAGPGGGSATKPVGLVEFACAERGGETVLKTARFDDAGRGAVRLSAVQTALLLLELKLGLGT
jgi:nicotinamide-nucleotide amidase